MKARNIIKATNQKQLAQSLKKKKMMLKQKSKLNVKKALFSSKI